MVFVQDIPYCLAIFLIFFFINKKEEGYNEETINQKETFRKFVNTNMKYLLNNEFFK